MIRIWLTDYFSSFQVSLPNKYEKLTENVPIDRFSCVGTTKSISFRRILSNPRFLTVTLSPRFIKLYPAKPSFTHFLGTETIMPVSILTSNRWGSFDMTTPEYICSLKLWLLCSCSWYGLAFFSKTIFTSWKSLTRSFSNLKNAFSSCLEFCNIEFKALSRIDGSIMVRFLIVHWKSCRREKREEAVEIQIFFKCWYTLDKSGRGTWLVCRREEMFVLFMCSKSFCQKARSRVHFYMLP